jgi:AcrR family transcriptional regulator
MIRSATKVSAVQSARTRDQAATRELLIQSVGTLLARHGFTSLGVNAVAKEAGVDKVLIYRYFGGLPELLRQFGSSGEFWPSVDALTGGEIETLRQMPLAQSVPKVMQNYISALRSRPLTREILAWESVERNELTKILEEVREQVSMELFLAVGVDPEKHPAVIAITTLFAAAVNYLIIRSRTIDRFNAMNIAHDDGWEMLEKTIATICERYFGPDAQ